MKFGIDCKGREYEEIPLGKIRNSLIGMKFNYLTPLFRVKSSNSAVFI